METMQDINTSVNSSPSTDQPSQEINLQSKNSTMPILLALLFSAIIFGAGGYYLGMQRQGGSTPPVTSTPNETDVITTPQIENNNDQMPMEQMKNYSYKNFSFQYPTDWQLSDNTTNKEFFDNTTLDFDRSVMLQKNGYYLLIGIDDIASGDVGGIFMNDSEYQEFIKNRDSINIGPEKFMLDKRATAFSWLTNKSTDGGGISGEIALSQYVPQSVKADDGNTYNGYEMYLKKNGMGYTIVKLAPAQEESTPADIQNGIILILESINW